MKKLALVGAALVFAAALSVSAKEPGASTAKTSRYAEVKAEALTDPAVKEAHEKYMEARKNYENALYTKIVEIDPALQKKVEQIKKLQNARQAKENKDGE